MNPPLENQLKLFCETLYVPPSAETTSFIELRLIGPDGPLGSQYMAPAGAHVAIQQSIDSAPAQANAYVGIALRSRRQGRKVDCLSLNALFCDLDIEELAEEEVVERIRAAGLPEATMMLMSGGGWHIYWCFNEPIALDGPKGPQTIRIEASNRGIAKQLGGDLATCDTSRIFRLPGTINYPNLKKQARGRVAVPVNLAFCEPERRYALEDFAALAILGATRDSGEVLPYDERPLTDEEEELVDSLVDADSRLGELYRREECENDSEHDMSLANAVARKINAREENGVVIEEVLKRSRDDYGDGKSSEAKGEPYYHLTVGKAIESIDRMRRQLDGADMPPDAELWQAPLYALNRDHTVLSTEKGVVVVSWQPDGRGFKTLAHHSRADFCLQHANEFIHPPDEEDPIPLAPYWLKWRGRIEAIGTVFDPTDAEHPGMINLYQGMGVEPDEMGLGTHRLMDRLLYEGICDSDDTGHKYLIKSLAWYAQNPGLLSEVAIVVRGAKGTGKGVLARAMLAMAGAHGYHLSDPQALLGRFNAHLAYSTFTFCDEAFWAGSSEAAGKLKALITEPMLAVEDKFKAIVMTPNRLTIMIASNEDWVVPASGGDERRFFVLDINPMFQGDKQFFDALHKEFYDDGGFGISAFYDYLREIPLGDWHPRDDVPATRGLENQVIASLDPIERFWLDALQEGALPDQEDWPERVGCGWAHKKCVEIARKLGRGKAPTMVEFSRGLKRLCPGMATIRPKATVGSGGRPRSFELPSLAECRAAFDKAMRLDTSW